MPHAPCPMPHARLYLILLKTAVIEVAIINTAVITGMASLKNIFEISQ
jgi:hypothetical protein